MNQITFAIYGLRAAVAVISSVGKIISSSLDFRAFLGFFATFWQFLGFFRDFLAFSRFYRDFLAF